MKFQFSWQKILTSISILMIWAFTLAGCTPVTVQEKTISISPSQFISPSASQRKTTDFLGLCTFTGGLAGQKAEPGEVLVGYDHRFDSEGFCEESIDYIYQGAVRFPIEDTEANGKLIQRANLKFNQFRNSSNVRRDSCAEFLGVTDLDWWRSGVRGLIPIRDTRRLPAFGSGRNFNVGVTSIVQQWSIGREVNNGFVLNGPKENFDSFSNRGMLTLEQCVSGYGNFVLDVTFFKFRRA